MNKIGYDLRRVKQEYYSVIEGLSLFIEETSKDGEAQLRVVFESDEDKTFIRLLQENSGWLNYAVNKRCADGIVIEIDSKSHSRCNLYIMELKRSVDSEKWTSDIKSQFRGATLRAMAFLSSLGITQVVNQEYFTGFVHSKMDDSVAALKAKQKVNTSSPIAKKGFLGVKDEEILEWEQGKIKVFGGEFAHHKVPLVLDDRNIGVGEVSISNRTL